MAAEANKTFFIYVTATGVVLTSVFIYCYFGNIVMWKYTEVADAVYRLQWNEYSLRMQIYVQMIMLYAQKPANISAYTVMRCNLQSFSKVRHSANKQRLSAFS